MDKRDLFIMLMKWLDEPVKNNAQAFYDQFVDHNAKIRSQMGMKATITREQVGKCCDWCARMVGTWEYGKHPKDIFRRHEYCKCLVTYNDDKTVSNVWNKKEFNSQREARIDAVKQIANETKKDNKPIDISMFVRRNQQPQQSLKIFTDLKNSGINFKRPKRLQIIDKEEIIAKISKEDPTNGSCASIAFTYAGNIAGYDVTDFRGGKSQEFFCKRSTMAKIVNFPGVDVLIQENTNDFKAVEELLKAVEKDKEYILASGQHVSIIRKTEKRFEYLELQSSQSDEQGFFRLTKEKLKKRFDCKANNRLFVPNYLIDLDSLTKSREFTDLLGYINNG